MHEARLDCTPAATWTVVLLCQVQLERLFLVRIKICLRLLSLTGPSERACGPTAETWRAKKERKIKNQEDSLLTCRLEARNGSAAADHLNLDNVSCLCARLLWCLLSSHQLHVQPTRRTNPSFREINSTAGTQQLLENKHKIDIFMCRIVATVIHVTCKRLKVSNSGRT